MGQSFDYREFINKIATLLKTNFQLSLIESNSIGEQLDFPFVTYTITSPYISTTQDIVENEIFEMIISFTIHTRSTLDALNTSGNINKWFRSDTTRLVLAKDGIVVVKATNSGSRDNFVSVDYERTAGFDIRFRVTDQYIGEQVEGISAVQIDY
ncbi:LIC_12616 family protein [Desemzia sp. FAM 23990]|uniref:phage neck terminator protein n=1 Tax=Desemzia sp. FAM 23990 TaxID=3259520 RepID=UPI0038882E72